MFRMTKQNRESTEGYSNLMDRIYPKVLADIKIEGVIWVKQILCAVKVRAKIIWKQPSSFIMLVHPVLSAKLKDLNTCKIYECTCILYM